MTEATSTAAMASAPASVSHAPAAPVPPIGLREKHKRRTRAAIRAAAMELFDANGYAQTTVAQIAEASRSRLASSSAADLRTHSISLSRATATAG